jgi:hypothetical protein
VHLTEKLCSFYHLGIQRHSSERAGKRDRGEPAVGARYIVRGRTDTTQTVLRDKYSIARRPRPGHNNTKSSCGRG